jgi:uncharacterized lipoprotein NlpE involved in copper resistance
MSQKIRLVVALVLIAPMCLALMGCKNNAQNGALIGAGAGALGGYIIGNESDK